MTVQIKILFADSALRDLEDVFEYYKNQKISHVGKKLVTQVIIDIELFGSQPDMRCVVPEFDLDYVRELIRHPFRIVYHRDQNKVRIVRVWRTERLLVLPGTESGQHRCKP